MGVDSQIVERIRDWMFMEALPFWGSAGLDFVNGGAVEGFEFNSGIPSTVGFKRTRVTCRQLYVFSHAEILGWPSARDASNWTYAFLREKHWAGPDLGWLRRVDTKGVSLDATPDLYDYAFALFALGWRYKARRDPSSLALAHATLDFMNARFRHPGGLGFHTALPGALPREQNPHMHLAEAALALWESTEDTRFLDLAEEVVALFKAHMRQPTNGVVPEFFDDDWRPVAGENGRWIEPGHQFEWAW
ncbi:MAG: AGE family epimerase/isomerase, partial [Alphaproteobacteria bacterium]|nr:AGE family epimerase/isomerase [Alphaproteobacteria bacterium]